MTGPRDERAEALPLREVLAQLAGHPSGQRLLADHGHGGLPDGLLTEAIVRYADGAPLEVAEHLTPFVAAHSPVPLTPGDLTPGERSAGAGRDDGAPAGLDLLASAPPVSWAHVRHELDVEHHLDAPGPAGHDGGAHAAWTDLDFGRGHDAVQIHPAALTDLLHPSMGHEGLPGAGEPLWQPHPDALDQVETHLEPALEPDAHLHLDPLRPHHATLEEHPHEPPPLDPHHG